MILTLNKTKRNPGVEFLTFYYPGFTECKNRNSSANCVVDEWALVRSHPRSVFAAHDPTVPLLGYTDSACRDTLQRETTLAAQHGIDAFVFNYYYDGRRTELEAPL